MDDGRYWAAMARALSGELIMPRRNTITIHAYPTKGPDTITLVDCPQPADERDPDLDPRPGVRMIVLPEGALHATRMTLDPMAVRQLRAALQRWEQGKDLAEPKR
jgi:hypothetical protein